MKLIFWCCILSVANVSSGIFLLMKANEKRCYLQNLEDEIIVLTTFSLRIFDEKTQDFVPAPADIHLKVEVNDPKGVTVLSRQFESKGKIVFTTHAIGDFQICFHTDATGTEMMRLFLNSKLNAYSDDPIGDVKSDQRDELPRRIEKLIKHVGLIQKRQEAERKREHAFRIKSESANSSVFWWSLAQILVLMASGVWQMKSLQTFFLKKKLV